MKIRPIKPNEPIFKQKIKPTDKHQMFVKLMYDKFKKENVNAWMV